MRTEERGMNMKKMICIVLVLTMLLPFAAFAGSEASRDFTAVRLNEFMASNGKKTIVDKNGESSDWIELYNTSDNDIDLEGLCLSDSKKNPEKFVFPSVILPAHGYIIVFCSGTESLDPVELHTAFKLNSAEGEKVVLSYKGVILDRYDYAIQQKNISMAVDAAGEWQYTSTPTPGHENVITPIEQ